MRKIKYTSRFKRDYKREQKGRHSRILELVLREIMTSLTQDQPLDRRYFDHALTGDWLDHRDCHLKPDLVLIYRKPNDETLELVRLGSHSELGL